MDKIVDSVRKKKSLAGVSSKIIESELSKYLKERGISIAGLSEKDERLIVKDIRQRLRKLTGSFHNEEGENDNLLESHSSTRERLEFYPSLREKIAFLEPKSILDLGSGVNPVALATPQVKYYAYDINERDLDSVQQYFNQNKIQGKTVVCDLRIHRDFPQVDICLMFKIVDLLDKKGHKITEEIIKVVNANYFIISFSTKTLSGAPMRHPQRGWIERLLQRLGFRFESFSSKNEIFYLASKESTGASLD